MRGRPPECAGTALALVAEAASGWPELAAMGKCASRVLTNFRNN
ncbi:hypothetical protein SNL152K_4779 [Streptomyces sp. NL15-2K]|nr:hypothetical protein SNL152K_4779 [Streptomyces sp. NL15-2K]